tara:strand:- start:1029 stop:1733 length:705 start_codon:yes stop_codon:yes gene_type:complete
MRKKLKQFETRRLFYAEYLYKLVLRNELSSIFRTELQKDEKLSYARKQLDQLTDCYRNNLPLYKKAWRADVLIDLSDYFDAIEIYNTLKNCNDYKLRIDTNSTLTLFSNNKKLLLGLAGNLKTINVDFWEPVEKHIELLNNTSKIIIVDTQPTLPLKIHFNSNRINQDFGKWIRANSDKCKIGKTALNNLEKYGYLTGLYMYVRDEKILNLVILLAGNSIRIVEKLVYVPIIDK